MKLIIRALPQWDRGILVWRVTSYELIDALEAENIEAFSVLVFVVITTCNVHSPSLVKSELRLYNIE